MKVAVILLVCFAAYIVAQAPATLDRFKSDYSFTLALSSGGGGGTPFPFKRAAEITGQDVLLPEQIRSELAKRQAGDFVTTVYGKIEADVPNNIWLQSVNRFVLAAGGMNIDFPLDATNLIYYDMNKNFTWDQNACECNPIEGSTEMPIISLPPFATAKSNSVSITINGDSVSAREYTATWNSGFASGNKKRHVQEDLSFTYTFYVDSSNQMRRVVFDVNVFGSTLKTTLDFWNIAAVNSDDQILPDAKCNGVCKSASVETATFPATCTAGDQCQCVANITFCKDIVTYPTTTLIHLAEVDSFTAIAYSSALDTMSLVGTVPDSCKSDLKVFLCKFYFPLCTSEVNIAKPQIDVFECKEASSSVKDAARDNRAFSAYNAANGETSSSAGSIVPAFMVVIASLLVINF